MPTTLKNEQDNVPIQPFFAQYPLAIQLPAIQYKAMNVLKPPKTQDSHLDQSITQVVKITVQTPAVYHRAISKLTPIYKVPSFILMKKIWRRIKLVL
jgi:hypothetical protein